MTEIEKKALALVNDVLNERGNYQLYAGFSRASDPRHEALCRLIEQHEAYKQEVSDVMTYIKELYPTLPRNFHRFIIPKPTVDPLVEVLDELNWCNTDLLAKDLREALAKRGLKIVEDV